MSLLTDDQKMLQETAASFLAEEGAIATQLRHWRDIGCADGFGHDLWKQFAELGLTGICVPESHGGLGLGATEAALVLEEIGRNLTPSPFPRALADSRKRMSRWSTAPRRRGSPSTMSSSMPTR